MGSTKTKELPEDRPDSTTPSIVGAAPQSGGDGLSAKAGDGPQQGTPKKFDPYFRLDGKKYVNQIAGFNMARVRNRLIRWLKQNKGDTRAEAVSEVLTKLVHAEEMFALEQYGKARWSAGASRGLASLRRLRPYVEVRHEEESHFRSHIVRGWERYQHRVEQFIRARQLIDELTGLLTELEPKLEARDRKFVAHLFGVPGVLKSRAPDARYLAVTQRRLKEAGLRLKEIALLFARATADGATIIAEAERIRVRIRTLNAEDRKEGGAPLLRW
jgi:hypothetical protein